MSDVQAGDSTPNGSEISEFGSRSSVSISSMAGEPSRAWRHGDQNCALRADVTSVRRATYWNHPSRVLRRRAVLDSCRFRIEAIGVQGLLQFASKSRWSRRQNTGGTSRGQRLRDLEIVSLAWPLSWTLSHANRGISRNSPRTSYRPTSQTEIINMALANHRHPRCL
jgi:hypothetical protein